MVINPTPNACRIHPYLNPQYSDTSLRETSINQLLSAVPDLRVLEFNEWPEQYKDQVREQFSTLLPFEAVVPDAVLTHQDIHARYDKATLLVFGLLRKYTGPVLKGKRYLSKSVGLGLRGESGQLINTAANSSSDSIEEAQATGVLDLFKPSKSVIERIISCLAAEQHQVRQELQRQQDLKRQGKVCRFDTEVEIEAGRSNARNKDISNCGFEFARLRFSHEILKALEHPSVGYWAYPVLASRFLVDPSSGEHRQLACIKGPATLEWMGHEVKGRFVMVNEAFSDRAVLVP